MKTVILAEKPNQAKLYAEAFEVAKKERTHIELKPCSTFPEGATITWGIGHLVEIATPAEHNEKWSKWNLDVLPILPEKFILKVAESKKAQFNAVKKILKESDFIINSCDLDREGSNIFQLILKVAGIENKKIKRLWINSLEVDEIRKGFNQLKDIQNDILMHKEAHARQIADWLVGMNGSPLYTLLLQKKGLNEVLSIGRCQSPLVKMIYDREQEIKHFVSKPFYELTANFTTSGQSIYTGKAKEKFENLSQVEAFLLENNVSLDTQLDGVITNVEKKEKNVKSPKLHSLSTLQALANKKWKYSPQLVLDTMQKLYEAKYVTYPRTDSNFITEAEFAYLVANVGPIQDLLNVTFTANTTAKKRYVDNSKVQEHFAIIPTKNILTADKLATLSEAERNIYDEIARNTLAMFHEDYVYEETIITTAINEVEFFTTGKIEKVEGWKCLFNQKDEDNNGDNSKMDTEKLLPNVSKQEKVLSNIHNKEGYTKPPKPFTEGQLIDLMKTAGKTIEDKADSEMLKEVEGIGTEATRASIIEAIKSRGYVEVTNNVVSVTTKGNILCQSIENTILSSPALTAKWESKLKLIGQGKLSLEEFVADIEIYIHKMINEAKVNTTNNINLENSISIAQTKNSIGTCPVCKKGEMVDRGNFVGCSDYKEGCKFSINRIIAKKKLTDKAIADIILKSKTGLIKGFTSAKNTKFDAMLIIKDNKVQFEFMK